LRSHWVIRFSRSHAEICGSKTNARPRWSRQQSRCDAANFHRNALADCEKQAASATMERPSYEQA
jgi:hypothetical protein